MSEMRITINGGHIVSYSTLTTLFPYFQAQQRFDKSKNEATSISQKQPQNTILPFLSRDADSEDLQSFMFFLKNNTIQPSLSFKTLKILYNIADYLSSNLLIEAVCLQIDASIPTNGPSNSILVWSYSLTHLDSTSSLVSPKIIYQKLLTLYSNNVLFWMDKSFGVEIEKSLSIQSDHIESLNGSDSSMVVLSKIIDKFLKQYKKELVVSPSSSLFFAFLFSTMSNIKPSNLIQTLSKLPSFPLSSSISWVVDLMLNILKEYCDYLIVNNLPKIFVNYKKKSRICLVRFLEGSIGRFDIEIKFGLVEVIKLLQNSIKISTFFSHVEFVEACIDQLRCLTNINLNIVSLDDLEEGINDFSDVAQSLVRFRFQLALFYQRNSINFKQSLKKPALIKKNGVLERIKFQSLECYFFEFFSMVENNEFLTQTSCAKFDGTNLPSIYCIVPERNN